MADPVTYTEIQGRWTIPKDPDDQDFYGVDMTDFLPAGVTILDDPAPEALVTGVELLEPAVVQGARVLAKLGGLNINEDATLDDNCCTFRMHLSNGARRDRTIYFMRKDY